MKKIITLLSFIVLAYAAKAQYVTIPDTSFRNFLISKYPSCFNSAKQMDTTCSAIVNETVLFCSHGNFSNIDGVQYFDKLKTLNCSNNILSFLPRLPSTLKYLDCSFDVNLTTLPALPNSIDTIYCWNNLINTLPTLPNSLINLQCSSNKLTAIPNLPNSLKTLACEANKITALPALPVGLEDLVCGFNPINQLPGLPTSLIYLSCRGCPIKTIPSLPNGLQDLNISGDTLSTFPSLPNSLITLDISSNNLYTSPPLPNQLKAFYCGENHLTSLPSLPATLVTLSCGVNQISSLNALPNQLTMLSIENNSIKKIPQLPATLKYLMISNNQVDTLPVLNSGLITLEASLNNLSDIPKLPGTLKNLYVSHNNLSKIPALPSTLTWLKCDGNHNLFCLPKLPSILKNLKIDSLNILCIPNKPIGLKITNQHNLVIDIPICNLTNNINQCQSYPTITGKIFHDINLNNAKDVDEAPKAYGLVMLSNGDYTFTDTSGVYSFQTDTLGTFYITTLTPTFYHPIPSIQYVTANKYDTTIKAKDIAFQPTATVDSMQVFATPIDVKARPGFGYPYFVGYANVGTTKLSPTIKLDYNNVYLNYDSCNNSSVANSGNSLNLVYPNMPAGFTSSYLAYFRVKPTAPLGDTIKATASITSATTSVLYETPYSVISGSFDPNDKDATPLLTPTQVALGKPINYTIRFQNTGNDTAFTVVLADTLSSLLQTNSLQLISSSHPCKVSVKKGIAYFEFINILLPDKNTNEIKSHGFVRFTVKPKTSLTAGTSIYNKAYIYFDYNAPIITNTAVTLIKAPVIVPVKMMSYELKMMNEKQVANLWTTATEINTSHFNVQRSIDGNDFKTVGIIAAKGTGDYSFIDDIKNLEVGTKKLYYRLEIVDEDGSKQYSEIRQLAMGNKQFTINIFPNPAKEIVTVVCKDAKELMIIDYLGKVVLSKSTFNNQQSVINIQALSKGLYTLKIVLKDQSVRTEKLIVE